MSDGLSGEQIAQLKSQLLEQRGRLLMEIHEELVRSGKAQELDLDLTQSVHDRGDESVSDLLVDVELAMIDSHRLQLRAVEEALVRIADGEYGLCQACGCEIPPARLEANPAVERCIDCQEQLEQLQSAPSL